MDKGGEKLGKFGEAVERARAELDARRPASNEKMGVKKKSPAQEPVLTSAKEESERVAKMQRDLLEAVGRGDVDGAKALVEIGAKVEGPFEKGWGLWECWFHWVRRNTSSANAEEVEAAHRMLTWMDDMSLPWIGVPKGKDGPKTVEQERKCARASGGRKSMREENIRRLTLYESFRSWGASALGPAAVRLAVDWTKDPRAARRVSGGYWLQCLQSGGGRDFEATLRFACELGRHGIKMSEAHWNMVAAKMNLNGSGVELGVGDLSIKSATIIDLVESQMPKGGLDSETMSLLIVHALSCDSLDELSVLAKACAKPLWRLDNIAWGMMSINVGSKAVRGPSLLECAASMATSAGARHKAPRSVECLSALALSPEAVAEFKDGGLHSYTMMWGRADTWSKIFEVAPMLLDPDKNGDTILHRWARGHMPIPEAQEQLGALAATKMGSLMFEPNKSGDTPMGIAMLSMQHNPEIRLGYERAIAQYESKQMRQTARRGTTKARPGKVRL